MVLLLGAAAYRRLPAYSLFAQGARKGLMTAVQVLPNLAAMLCSLSVMRASGLMDALTALCTPFLTMLGLPAEVAPLVVMKPLSGSGALGVLGELLQTYGADSRTGMIASTVAGFGETVFYTACLYAGSIGEAQTGYAIPCSLAGLFAGVCLCGLLF